MNVLFSAGLWCQAPFLWIINPTWSSVKNVLLTPFFYCHFDIYRSFLLVEVVGKKVSQQEWVNLSESWVFTNKVDRNNTEWWKKWIFSYFMLYLGFDYCKRWLNLPTDTSTPGRRTWPDFSKFYTSWFSKIWH